MLSSRLAPVKFLLVDDLEEDLFAWTQILARDGLQLVTALSAPLALEALLVHDFALAIIDVQMPEINGVELAELMRGAERTCHIPIILVTAGSREHQGLFRGYEAGAVDFLYKPIEPLVLRNKAETFHELYRHKQREARQRELLQDRETELQRTHQALQRSHAFVEAANRAKEEFLANVSHEIRTPMNAILGLTDLVLESPLADGQRQSLKTVRAAAGSLLGTLNDLLDFAKIEAGKLELDRAPFSLREALRDALRAVAPRAYSKGLELVCGIEPTLADDRWGDGGRLRQVLINLLGNAIKFTERGEVVLDISAAGARTPQQGTCVDFSVRDTGIGIPIDKQDTVFRAFEQEDTSTTRKYGGTGLGLTISAQLIALMGGQLGVESARGVGSTFRFSVDLGTSGTARYGAENDALAGLEVLVVDHLATRRRVIETWLRAWKMRPTLVNDTEAAEEILVSSAAQGRHYAILIVDGTGSSADAIEFARANREACAVPPPRLVMLTSGSASGAAERWGAGRADACLAKPILDDELRGTLVSLLDGKLRHCTRRCPERLDAAVGPVVRPSVRLRIIIAEDNEFNSQLMSELLSRRGHFVRIARTGAEALHQLEVDGCDLLLLDVHMPELDGFQVIRVIRQREQATGRRLPVLAVTARCRKEDRERCLDAGMDDYLAKPINAASLLAAVDRLGLRPDPSP